MQLHKGRVIAAGILCAIAATVAVWSGPLASASGTFHTRQRRRRRTCSADRSR